ncbi:MAG: hypothetical protein QXT56_02430, partial [Candidatus Nitrosocaldus sp.]
MRFRFLYKRAVVAAIASIAAIAIVSSIFLLSIQPQDTNITPSKKVEVEEEKKVTVEEEKGIDENVSIGEMVKVNVVPKKDEGKEEMVKSKEESINIKKEEETPQSKPTSESIPCLLTEGEERLPTNLTVNLSLSNTYGIPKSRVYTVASINSNDESLIFTLTHVKFAWFSTQDGSRQLSEWEEARIYWDYSDDGSLVGRASAYIEVPDAPANTNIMLLACLLESSPTKQRELGFTTHTFKVIQEEKVITYYRVDKAEDIPERVVEALTDRGISFSVEKVTAL